MIIETVKSDVVTNKGTGLVIPTVASALKLNSIGGNSVQNGTPTPDAPVDINSVNMSAVKATGKNLIPCNKASRTINGITFTVNSDKSITINGTSTAKATFIVADSVTLEVGSYIFGNNYRPYNVTCAVDQKKNNSWELVAASHGGEFKVTEENTDRTFSFYFSINSGVTVNNATVYPILRRSSDSDIYVPYQGENTVNLSAPVTLRGLGDVKDVICKQGNVWGVLRRVGVYTIDSSLVSSLQMSSSTNFVYLSRIMSGIAKYNTTSNAETNNIISDKFTKRPYDGLDSAYYDNGIAISTLGSLCFRIKGYDFNAYKNYITNNTITVLYELATPVFEPLPDADQNVFNSLRSYDGITNIFTDSTVEPEVCVTNAVSLTGAYVLESDRALGGCYFKREGDKFYVGYDDGTSVAEMEV